MKLFIRYLLLCIVGGYASVVVGQVPINPNATRKTKELLAYIHGIKGKLITGQHHYNSTPGALDDADVFLFENTGEYPALWGCDFSYGDNLAVRRSAMMDKIVERYNAGSIITITYHIVRPQDPETAGWNAVRASLTEAEYKDVVTPGTDLYNKWEERLDLIAGYLKTLQDLDIPIVWRPYHEMNNLFWWGQGKVQGFILLSFG